MFIRHTGKSARAESRMSLTFLSGAFMQLSLAPHWIRSIAKFNPVNWAVEAGRAAATHHTAGTSSSPTPAFTAHSRW
jgi:hypothetical protein